MITNQDFRDLFAEFNAQQVDFIIVGAHALAAHGHIRATKDIDVWIRPDKKNAKRVYSALQNFGAPLFDLTIDDLSKPGTIFQIGIAPIRIDIITKIDGVDFAEAWPERVKTQYDDQPVSVLSRKHLIQNKKASGRLQDLADIEQLEATQDGDGKVI